MTELVAEGLSVCAGGAQLLDGASFRLRPGEFAALLGPNGAGKTTLVRAALGLQRAHAGRALLDGADTARLGPAERARGVAYLPQSRPLAWPALVRDVVALGRFSHGAAPGRLRGADAEAVARALAACGLEALAGREADTLSGGERARMHCARAFAAEAPLLVADEPTAALDPSGAFRILDLVAAFVAEGGGALVVLHDIGLAARYATRLLWMKGGRLVADGTPEETLSGARLADIYGVEARVEGRRVELLGAVQGAPVPHPRPAPDSRKT